VYAARKQIKTALVAAEFGGQSNVSEDIQNWIGTPHISGMQLAKDLENHVREYAGDVVEILKGAFVEKIEKDGEIIKTILKDGKILESKSLLITVGSARRKLDAKNADIFEHKGLTYCASCDGPMFSGMPVAVIGGGNAAFESAAQLSAYCEKVYLINRSANFKADEITVESANKNPKIEIITNAIISEIIGEQFVSGLKYTQDGTEKELSVKGIFVEIGQIPNTTLAEGIVERDSYNKIIIDHKRMRTSVDGIWAAGDCTDVLYHQNNIAAGDAVKALEDIYQWLQLKK
jgi:alkyl hydroperoxide reductase subunit F